MHYVCTFALLVQFEFITASKCPLYIKCHHVITTNYMKFKVLNTKSRLSLFTSLLLNKYCMVYIKHYITIYVQKPIISLCHGFKNKWSHSYTDLSTPFLPADCKYHQHKNVMCIYICIGNDNNWPKPRIQYQLHD